MDPNNKEEYMSNLRSEIQSQMMKDLLNKITDNCFKKCTGQKGEGIDNSERQCIGNCVGRYMETMSVVHSTIETRQK